MNDSSVELAYEGLDDTVRRVQICFSPVPNEATETSATYALEVPPQERQAIFVNVCCNSDKGACAGSFRTSGIGSRR